MILFIILGIILSLISVIISYTEVKAIIYFALLIGFFVLVIAYVTMSVAKLKIAKLDYLKNTSIVYWGENEKKAYKFPFILSGILAILFGCMLIVNGADYLHSLLLTLGLGFELCGWILVALKRYNEKNNHAFILSHMGMLYNGKIRIFNGSTKGIIDCKSENGNLIITLINNKKEETVSVKIPQDKILEVDDFLTDLRSFFDEQE